MQLYRTLISLQNELDIPTPVPYPVMNQYGFPSNMVSNIASLAGGNVLNPFATNESIMNLYRAHQLSNNVKQTILFKFIYKLIIFIIIFLV